MELESVNYGSLSANDLFFSRHSLLIGVKEGEFSDSSCINLNMIKLYSSLSLLPCTFPIYECTWQCITNQAPHQLWIDLTIRESCLTMSPIKNASNLNFLDD